MAADTAAAPVGPEAPPSAVADATAAATAALVGRFVRARFLLLPLPCSRFDTAPSNPGPCTLTPHSLAWRLRSTSIYRVIQQLHSHTSLKFIQGFPPCLWCRHPQQVLGKPK